MYTYTPLGVGTHAILIVFKKRARAMNCVPNHILTYSYLMHQIKHGHKIKTFIHILYNITLVCPNHCFVYKPVSAILSATQNEVDQLLQCFELNRGCCLKPTVLL